MSKADRRPSSSRRPIAAALALGLALTLAGCSKGGSDEETNASAAEPAGTTVEVPEAAPVIPAEPTKPLDAENLIAPEEDKLSEEEQMQEDAEATGMTSRMPAQEGVGNAAEDVVTQ